MHSWAWLLDGGLTSNRALARPQTEGFSRALEVHEPALVDPIISPLQTETPGVREWGVRTGEGPPGRRYFSFGFFRRGTLTVDRVPLP